MVQTRKFNEHAARRMYRYRKHVAHEIRAATPYLPAHYANDALRSSAHPTGLSGRTDGRHLAMMIAGGFMHQSLEEYEFQLFKWHVKETDTLIDKMIKDETSYIKNQTDTGDTEQDDSGMVAAEYYMCRVRYSHVIHLASLFESMLQGECDRLAQAIGENNLLFKLSELKGESWVVKRRFIERYGQFEIPDEIWQPAEDLLKVRNVVIHANGAIDSRQPDQKRAIEKQPGISIESGYIKVSGEYANQAAISIENLSKFIAQKVQRGRRITAHGKDDEP